MDRLGGYWWLVLPAWLWALLLLWAASGGVICALETMGLFAVGAPIALIWFGNTPACLKELTGRARRLWFSVPVVWMCAVLLSRTDAPMLARLCLSESALRQYAEGDDLGPSRDTNAKYVG